jgi:hemerythrin-like domain-containing protein
MVMPDNNLPDSLPGFDDPLGMLRACHQNTLSHCDMLEELVTRYRNDGFDEKARQAARKITRYFSTSAPLHHRDEEADLFPRINRQSLKIAELIHDLKEEHKQLDDLWIALEPALKRLPDGGFSDEFVQEATAFCQLSREHVQRENMELLPIAASSLSQEALGEVGESMAERRGIYTTGL